MRPPPPRTPGSPLTLPPRHQPLGSPGLRSQGPRPQVLELVSSDSLNVPSEEDVYRAVLSWVKHDVDTRRPYVPRVRQGPGATGAEGVLPGPVSGRFRRAGVHWARRPG